eukprot:3720218-Alexandrium_andersonii.AAC.1
MREATDAVMLASNKLAHMALAAGDTAWQLKPKHHQILELVREAESSRINPGMNWTFGDEDFCGHVFRVAKRCHRKTVVRSTVRRHLLRTRLQFSDLGS